MEKIDTQVDGVCIIKSKIFFDERGFFSECLNLKDLGEIGLDFVPVQVNHSFNKAKGTLRGLHFQTRPFEQAKIVTCLKGAIFDVAVNIIPESKNFLRNVSCLILSPFVDETILELETKIKCDYILKYPDKFFIPKGFAHGYLTLLPESEVLYFTDNFYSPENDCVLRYNDPQIAISWPNLETDFILSIKDRNAPFVSEFDFSKLKKL
ncbi:MAG: dTDP-4-dehydrorhamnose 3,5-epimerase [Ignavibacteria bacterium]|nr:dTDP-4-dehydrorhamnose 3,5-epimerase [Ignavibacteria bacterium]